MHVPSFRAPQIIEGLRGAGPGIKPSNFMLLTDIQSLDPKPGEGIYMTQHGKLQLLLRGAKALKRKDGTLYGEIDPLQVQFDGGLFRTEDKETIELLDKHKGRRLTFFSLEDVKEMKTTTEKRVIDEIVETFSPEVVQQLRQRLDAKHFPHPPKSAA